MAADRAAFALLRQDHEASAPFPSLWETEGSSLGRALNTQEGAAQKTDFWPSPRGPRQRAVLYRACAGQSSRRAPRARHVHTHTQTHTHTHPPTQLGEKSQPVCSGTPLAVLLKIASRRSLACFLPTSRQNGYASLPVPPAKDPHQKGSQSHLIMVTVMDIIDVWLITVHVQCQTTECLHYQVSRCLFLYDLSKQPSGHLQVATQSCVSQLLFLYSSNYFILEMSPKDIYTPIYKTLTLRESQKIRSISFLRGILYPPFKVLKCQRARNLS